MKRIGWIAMFLGVALIVEGCSNTETQAPDKKPVKQEPAKKQPAQQQPADEQLAAPGPTEPPAGGAGAKKDTGKVAGAVGRALLKGIGGKSKTDDPGEMPEY